MTVWKTAALGAALLATAGIGAAVMPVAQGQGRPAPQVRAVQIFGGGSQIGLSIRDVDPGQAAGAAGGAGVLVEDVEPDSPAATAGVRKGDVIVEFDGERVRSARQLTRLVQETPAGRTVQATVLRDGQRTTVSVVPREGGRLDTSRLEELAEWGREFGARVAPVPPVPAVPGRPAPPAPPSPWDLDELVGRAGRLGITVRALSPQLAEYFGVERGALVSSVTEGSVAATAGLKAGDVITTINGASVAAPADVRRHLQAVKEGDEVTIAVMRDRKALTLKARLERTERRQRTRVTV